MTLTEMNLDELNNRILIIKNPRLWAIIFITALFVFMYSAWPWTQVSYTIVDRILPLHLLRELGIFEFRHHIIGSLFFLPILYSTLIFSWRGGILTWIIACCLICYNVSEYSSRLEYCLMSLLFLAIPLLAIMVITIELNWRQKQRELLAAREAERETMRRASILNIIEAQENERRFIAHNLHDETIQNLLTIANRTEILSSDITDNTTRKYFEWMNNIILNTVEDLRRLCAHLRPRALDNLGLIPAMRLLIDKMNKESEIEFRIHVEGDEQKLPSIIEVNVFRMVQEALTNVRRHSQATQATLSVYFNPKSLKITAEDNGQGFKTLKMNNSDFVSKLGMEGMRWRIESLGGVFRVYSEIGVKTVVTAELQYEKCVKYAQSQTNYNTR